MISDESSTYLTQPAQTKLKRIYTGLPGRRDRDSRGSSRPDSQFQSLRPTTGLKRQSHFASQANLERQSMIVQDGLVEYKQKLQIIEIVDQREAGKIFCNPKDFETVVVDHLEKKKGPSVKVIPRDLDRAELDKNLMNVVEMQQCIFKYLEVKLKGQNKPLYLFFFYTDPEAKFKMFLSRHTYTPNIFNCEMVFQKKVVLKYNEPGDTLQFQSDSVYLAVFCSQQSTIQLKVQFGSGITSIKSFKRVKPEDEEPKPSDEAIRRQMFLINKQRRQKMLSTMGEDLLQKNLKTQMYTPKVKEQRLLLRRVQSAQRISEVLEKKKVIDEDKKNIIIAKYEHSEKVKILREIFRCYNQIDMTLNERAKAWMNWIYIVLIVQKIKQNYNNQIRKLVEKTFKRRVQNKIRMQISQSVKKKAETIIKRTMMDQTQAIHVLMNVCRKSAKHRAIGLIEKFMRGYGLIGELLTKMNHFKQFAMKVEERFLLYKKRCKAYTDRIAKLWNIKWGVMYQQIIKEDMEKVRELRKNLNKQIINLQFEEERTKAPFIDSKMQNFLVQQLFKEMKQQYHKKMTELFRAINKQRATNRRMSLVNSNIIMAAQEFGGENSALKQIKLFSPINDKIIFGLVYKYMSEKKLLYSEQLSKQEK